MNCESSSVITGSSDLPSLFALKSRNSNGEQGSETLGTLSFKINQLKKKIQAERVASIREKVEENQKKVEGHVGELLSSAVSKNSASTSNEMGLGKLLLTRIGNPICIIRGILQGCEERDCLNCDDTVTSTTAILPLVEKIPPYTTWIFLDKNQRMAEDQSVVGRRRIYYDPHGSEALICSDSEEEIVEPEEEKHEFSEGEDRILRMVSTEYVLDEEIFKILAQVVGGTNSEILDRCDTLKKESEEVQKEKYSKSCGEVVPEESVFLGKSLSASLETFDNLFCRRCLVFDCRLHGCSQVIIKASEKHPSSAEYENNGIPCSDQCFLQLKGSTSITELLGFGSIPVSGSEVSKEGCGSPVSPNVTEPECDNGNTRKRMASESLNAFEADINMVPDDLQESSQKKSKSCLPNAVSVALEDTAVTDHSSTDTSRTMVHNGSEENKSTFDVNIEKEQREQENIKSPSKFKQINSLEGSAWKPLEKDLYLKGLEIFGKNSCLIARNLLPGLKTCIEVSRYMDDDESEMPRGFAALGISCPQDNERKMPGRSRIYRKRGRTRKLKYSWKSAGHPSIWRRIADGKNQSGKQYTPCGCESLCGKECPCLHNTTCCEKYCGCSKSCKNRFRGCHCAKSQCRSRQCPCFAAGRECDPDVCRNCWISCGDGSLGEPPKRGDGQCGNMRLLLRQKQRILLAKSDVAGWGAFLKNPVSKNEYLGEYTGELVSHREADKRGKIYDRANSSFLFDLNDQYVLDAYRKGDKLKFANHSSNPNCYAKVMMVAGDHRVGIFANERIEAGEELFYDYRYNPDQAPSWARKPEGSKRDEFPVPQGRAKKHQSH